MPNVVFIMTDNQGAWTLGCYGNPDIRTPNINRLADEGIRFSNAYCVNSVLLAQPRHIHDWTDPLSARRTLLPRRRKNRTHRWGQTRTAPFGNLQTSLASWQTRAMYAD